MTGKLKVDIINKYLNPTEIFVGRKKVLIYKLFGKKGDVVKIVSTNEKNLGGCFYIVRLGENDGFIVHEEDLEIQEEITFDLGF